ncbi:ABC transporter permease [Bacteroidota bacterium]
MILKLAWRNIWRNKRRSIIVLLSVIVGVNSLLFMDGLTNGMLKQILFNQISSSISHIQIHKKGFNDNKIVQNYITSPEDIEQELDTLSSIKNYSKRVITFGLLSSASNSSGVYLNGINPIKEESISIIKESVFRGEYLSGNKREIVIGKRLADKLKVDLGDKVVALSNTLNGNIGSEVFRIVGIFKTASSEFDKAYVYTPTESIQEMLDLGKRFYEYAIITHNYNNSSKVRDLLRERLGDNFEVLSYEDLLPFVIMQLEMYKESLFIIILIIGLALIFGIINTMLMSVFERIKEFGVLISIGMKNYKLFFMVVLEAFIIGCLGTIIGIITGYLINIPLEKNGIDLSIFADSLQSFGVGAILYPTLSLENFIITFLMIPVISVIGAIYPAIKALRLQPVYALRYV